MLDAASNVECDHLSRPASQWPSIAQPDSKLLPHCRTSKHLLALECITCQCGLHTGLILVVVAALQHGLTWSASAFELLHYAQGHLTTAQKGFLEQLHGIKHISSLLHLIEHMVIVDEACRSLGKMSNLAAYLTQ